MIIKDRIWCVRYVRKMIHLKDMQKGYDVFMQQGYDLFKDMYTKERGLFKEVTNDIID